MNKSLLLSVKEEFAEKIFAGVKTIELRRRRPRLYEGDYLIIYVPAPQKCLVGVATVDRVIEGSPTTLWRKARDGCAITRAEFLKYFSDVSVGYGIVLSRPARLASPLALDTLREIQPTFSPQGYKYLSREDVVEALVRLRPYRSTVH